MPPSVALRRRPSTSDAATSRALRALSGDFVVADLETTGLSAASCEILEFAAVAVDIEGWITREFSQVVRIQGTVPSFIARLTGISQQEVTRQGQPVEQVFGDFRAFVGAAPVFFHNAAFDTRFLLAASQRCGLPFDNETYCTLRLARQAWPELASHKLGILAHHLGAATPTHRALADVHTTVAVVLAARARLAVRQTPAPV
ncbi:PolC-type DNA polymerase III [Bordetella holmesii]|uniref:3'-5' exonuclease n=1 Tax=Bordetella holmesii TaxID=35814 RepID=UPI001D13D934|nr:3'-5' exonuclease [Bordetella holmesii]UEB20891.1 3'-5' exonuclease [Bordetella holmesii]